MFLYLCRVLLLHFFFVSVELIVIKNVLSEQKFLVFGSPLVRFVLNSGDKNLRSKNNENKLIENKCSFRFVPIYLVFFVFRAIQIDNKLALKGIFISTKNGLVLITCAWATPKLMIDDGFFFVFRCKLLGIFSLKRLSWLIQPGMHVRPILTKK